MPITHDTWGVTGDGAPIARYTLANGDLRAQIITYGGIITSLHAPDRRGEPGEVTLGFDMLAPYLGRHPYFGAICGRYANRIAGGRFTLDGVTYTLARNNGPNALHGGLRGFDRQVWRAEAGEIGGAPALSLQLTSPDGDEGYPGTLDVTVVYTLTGANELRIDYTATTDRATVLNLTNHTYFNLAGTGDVLGHLLQLDADLFLPTDATQIPTGELRPVRGTPMDFTAPAAIGARLSSDDPQIGYGNGGYDHTWVVRRDGPGLVRAARVVESRSGRVLEAFTTEPGVHLYTGNNLDGSIRGRNGQTYPKYAALCLEAQHFPDSPNHPEFPTTVLRPGETYRQTTVYRFDVE